MSTCADTRIQAGAHHGPPDPPMSAAAMKYLLARPKVPAPLDPNFAPFVLGKKNYLRYASGSPHTMEFALERAGGLAAREKCPVFADNHADVDASIHMCGVMIQQLMWERSGFRLSLCGPPKQCEALKKLFSVTGRYAFEVKTMPKVCGTPDVPFEVRIVSKPDELAVSKDQPIVCGKDASGCRLAFDLGKSDIKTVAVRDNQVIESSETEWDVTNPDPQYHWDAILKAMKATAAKLPYVEAIGGSATGTVGANNEAHWCDIFPNVPPDVYKEKVTHIFNRLAKEFGENVPIRVINDGEVTALAAIMKIGAGNVLGISMGSSEGGGYANKDGNLMGWISEFCYILLDLNPEAPYEPWTPHCGISHMYLGQRGATKLASKAGLDVGAEMNYNHPSMNTTKHEPHAQCLKKIQAAIKDPALCAKATLIYETVGVYLGYGIAQYSEHYLIDHLMIMGRVSTGAGGDIMLKKAKEVLAAEFPHLMHIQFHTPDDHFKRVGQCIAAAALPELKKK